MSDIPIAPTFRVYNLCYMGQPKKHPMLSHFENSSRYSVSVKQPNMVHHVPSVFYNINVFQYFPNNMHDRVTG